MGSFGALRVVVFCMGFYGAAASAADPGLNLQTQIGRQKITAQLATNQPAVVAQARGPLHADINVRNQMGQCLALASAIYSGVCVPVGPGAPVSPN